ncbi:hypothetical protein, partial [Neisseria sicca]|uniref:hypothetical protein n=1 Tax=Neisseria sicca TaxID=490 RepID=UPI001C99FD88
PTLFLPPHQSPYPIPATESPSNFRSIFPKQTPFHFPPTPFLKLLPPNFPINTNLPTKFTIT